MPLSLGVFTRLFSWQDDRDDDIYIVADRHDQEDDGIAAALNLAFYRDGQAKPTQNWDMDGKRLTNLGAGVDPNDSVRMQQLTDAISPGYSNIGDYLTTLRAPGSNWLVRNGQTILQSAYTALFALIGHSYGRPSGFNAQPDASTGNLYCIAAGAGKLVVGGNLGSIRYSANNGLTWAAATTPGAISGESVNCVCFGNGLFVACTAAGKIVTSADGVTWTLQTSGSVEAFFAVAYGNGLYVAVGNTASNIGIYTSPDGVSWSPRSISGFTANLKGVAYGYGVWVAVGVGGAVVVSSNAGVAWRVSSGGTANDFRSIAYGRGKFVAVGNKIISTSTNGNGWKPQGSSNGTGSDLLAITYGPGGFVAVSYFYTTSSTDGETWVTHTATTLSHNAVIYGADAFYTVDANGKAAKSIASYNTVTEFQIPDDGADIDYVKAL